MNAPDLSRARGVSFRQGCGAKGNAVGANRSDPGLKSVFALKDAIPNGSNPARKYVTEMDHPARAEIFALPLRCSSAESSLEQDCQQNDHSFHDVLVVTRNVLQVHKIANDSENQDPDDGVQGGTATAHKVGAANHNGCDHIELHADADHRGTNAGPSRFYDSGFRQKKA
jgi:hypothetical protein